MVFIQVVYFNQFLMKPHVRGKRAPALRVSMSCGLGNYREENKPESSNREGTRDCQLYRFCSFGRLLKVKNLLVCW